MLSLPKYFKMSIIKFITSKTFLIQLVIAALLIVLLAFGLLKFLSYRTNHDETIKVPDLATVKANDAQTKLETLGLELYVLDTVDFNPDIPPFTIVEQDPVGNSNVKNGRKIYVKINAGEYSDVILPDLVGKTYRQVSANIKSLGLKEGKKTYRPHIAKDEVLSVLFKGKVLKRDDKVKKNASLDFVLGDGKELYTDDTFMVSDAIDK